MSEQITKATLFDKVSSGYNAFEKLLSPLTQAQMLVPEVNGGWSIKDNIAHITSWHQRLLELLQAAEQRRPPAKIPETLDDATVDQINEHFYQENKSLTLDVVLQRFRTSYIQVIATIQVLSDEDFTDTQRFAWLEGTLLWQVVKDNTYGHYQEHAEIIQAWLKQVRQHSMGT